MAGLAAADLERPHGKFLRVLAVLPAVAVFLFAPALPAQAALSAPAFSPSIDDYATYDPQSACDPTPKPGVTAFKDLLEETYGSHGWGIGRGCAGDTSEHYEGRALDYHFDYYDASQRAQAEDLLNWLFATDQYGNTHAMARRLGLMYIIWNRQIWGSYYASAGWLAYTGSNPHTDHIHFSFSWAGALMQTSWWNPVDTTGGLRADFNGDGRDDLGIFYTNNNGSMTFMIGYGTASGLNGVPVSKWSIPPGSWDPAAVKVTAGDYNGDGKADLGIYYGRADWSAQFLIGYGTSTGVNAPVTSWSLGAGSWDRNAVKLTSGDYNGDGRDDLGVFYANPNGAMTFMIGYGAAGGINSVPVGKWGIPPGSWEAAAIKVTSGDYNGDGKADLGIYYGRSDWSALFMIGYGTSTGINPPVASWSLGAGSWDRNAVRLTSGDYNGDNKADLGVFYANPNWSMTFLIGYGTAGGVNAVPAGKWSVPIGSWEPAAIRVTNGDYNGDGRADLGIFYGRADLSAMFMTGYGTSTGINAPITSWSLGAGSWDRYSVKLT